MWPPFVLAGNGGIFPHLRVLRGEAGGALSLQRGGGLALLLPILDQLAWQCCLFCRCVGCEPCCFWRALTQGDDGDILAMGLGGVTALQR